MPIYEYACQSCEHQFEELVSASGTVMACPKCTSGDVEKLFSSFARPTAAQVAPASYPRRAGGGCCGGGGCAH